MSALKLCTVCGVVTTDGRCTKHPRTSGIGANHAVHADPRWTALSQRMVARHVGQYGWVCPGDGPDHPAHPSHDLTTDHVIAIEDGGAPFPSDDQLRVLCRSWNSTLGARLVNARRAQRIGQAEATYIEVKIAVQEGALDERAQIRARYLG